MIFFVLFYDRHTLSQVKVGRSVKKRKENFLTPVTTSILELRTPFNFGIYIDKIIKT